MIEDRLRYPALDSRELILFVLKKPGASHRDKTETLRHWRAPFFPALREKKATRYEGGSLLKHKKSGLLGQDSLPNNWQV